MSREKIEDELRYRVESYELFIKSFFDEIDDPANAGLKQKLMENERLSYLLRNKDMILKYGLMKDRKNGCIR